MNMIDDETMESIATSTEYSLVVNADRVLMDGIEIIPFEDMCHCIPPIHRVVFDEHNGTTIQWGDGSRTHVRCGQGEKFERYAGFMAAVCKKLFGSTSAAKRIMDRKDAALIAEKRRKEVAKHQAEQHEREIRNIQREINRMVKRKKMEMVADAIVRNDVHGDDMRKYLEACVNEETSNEENHDAGD